MGPDTTPNPTLKIRDPKFKKADVAAVHAMVQAAINVELFTIPLYMVSMYSIRGMHQITSKDNDFYEGRLWPGAGPSAKPDTPEKKAFNLIFSVFIEEMLHLQLISNMATALGVVPSFTSSTIQTENHGWKCYGSDLTTIPHILDFKDCKEGDSFKDLKVKLGPMNAEQIKLFLAIEETMENAKEHIDPKYIDPDSGDTKYFQPAPFDDFLPHMKEDDLPMFGSIGWMYICLWDYIMIVYRDGTKLIDILIRSWQRDQFNHTSGGHPSSEYPGFAATIDYPDSSGIEDQILEMINAITDQGEGKGVVERIRERWDLGPRDKAVEKEFQPDPNALTEDYPGYDGRGNPDDPSGQAKARIEGAAKDHYEIFEEVQGLINSEGVETWDRWHADPSNKWTAEMLNPEGTVSRYNIPAADKVAEALNDLKSEDEDGENYRLFTQAAVGSIAGITTVLDQYWLDARRQFPSPAMYGSGDRVSICWAIFGKCPDLSQGTKPREKPRLYHSCQGMDFNVPPDSTATCAAVEVFHSCKGSNHCKAEGGCGFVQNTQGGGNCSQSAALMESVDPEPVILPTMSAPSDNRCNGFGGCAIPISASQLFPDPPPHPAGSYVMQLYNFSDESSCYEPKELPNHQIRYNKGDAVYDIAWKAYCEVMAVRGEKVGQPPPASKIRLAFPPST